METMKNKKSYLSVYIPAGETVGLSLLKTLIKNNDPQNFNAVMANKIKEMLKEYVLKYPEEAIKYFLDNHEDAVIKYLDTTGDLPIKDEIEHAYQLLIDESTDGSICLIVNTLLQIIRKGQEN